MCTWGTTVGVGYFAEDSNLENSRANSRSTDTKLKRKYYSNVPSMYKGVVCYVTLTSNQYGVIKVTLLYGVKDVLLVLHNSNKLCVVLCVT